MDIHADGQVFRRGKRIGITTINADAFKIWRIMAGVFIHQVPLPHALQFSVLALAHIFDLEGGGLRVFAGGFQQAALGFFQLHAAQQEAGILLAFAPIQRAGLQAGVVRDPLPIGVDLAAELFQGLLVLRQAG